MTENGDDYDGLEKAAGGDISPTAELLDQTFTLIDFEAVGTRFKDETTGGQRNTQIATLILEGEAEEQRFWLGGVMVNRQLAWLKTTGRLPMLIKLGGKGTQDSPYKLVQPDGEDTESPLAKRARAAGPKVVDALEGFRDKDGKLDGVGFVRFWQDQGYGPDELSDIVHATTPSAVEHWFKTHKGKTMNDLLAIAQANREEPEELPFE